MLQQFSMKAYLSSDDVQSAVTASNQLDAIVNRFNAVRAIKILAYWAVRITTPETLLY